MAVQMSGGKWQRLKSLTDEEGRFKMMAVDQRGSLVQALARAAGKEAQQVGFEDVAGVKATITRALGPLATAVLTDPVYGYPYSIQDLPPRVGLLLAYEETGYDKAGPSERERKSSLIEGWSLEKAQRSGADAAKLLIYYRPDTSQEVLRHQQDLVRRVGEECGRLDMPFLLELVGYPLDEGGADTAEYARGKPDVVRGSAAEFSKPEYGVDILKLEFPADLRYTREYSAGAFDGKERQPVYTLAEVRESCRKLDEAALAPWVILSAGVDIEEFLVQVDLAVEAGASGFLCGRAIWKDAIGLYPDLPEMERWLITHGAYNFTRANACARMALPWDRHRKFGGSNNIQLAGRSPDWYATAD